VAWTLADVERSIPEVFSDHARRSPSKPAVAGSEFPATFGQLDAAANRRAHAVLDRCGPGPARTALLMADDTPLIAATLGVLKAGKTTVVINPSDPPGRVEQVLRDARPELVLVDAGHAEVAASAGASPAEVMTIDDAIEGPAVEAPDVRVDPRGLAQLVYTSGSTGRPKGVMQTHRSLLHTVGRLTNVQGVGPEDRLPLLVSTGGWGGTSSLWTALLNGATICPFPLAVRGMTGLAAWAAEQRITVLTTYSSVYRHLTATLEGRPCPPLRLVLLGGEHVLPADRETCRRLFGPDCEFMTAFGSTEAGVVTVHRVGDVDPADGPLPAGRAVDWLDVALLDETGAPVAPGQTGEIVIRNEYRTPGYWGDEVLNAARFGEPGTFRSGDLGRLTPDGLLSVVGRTDLQVKIRGNRILLTDVEGALAALPEITGAAVCPTPTPRGHQTLTAFLTTRPGVGLTGDDVRRAVRGMLPEREIPTGFVFLDSLPLTPRGKVDRERLAAMTEPMAPAPEADAGEPSQTEATLAAIWAAAFEIERVGRADDFFALGGDSLTAAVISAEVHEALGVDLDLRDLVDNPSAARLAQVVDRRRASAPDEDRPALVPVSREEPLPLSFAQERTWLTSRTPEQSAGYTDATSVHIRGPLDVDRFRRAVDRLVERHEMLRTTFTERDGRPVQVVHPPAAFDLPLVDVSSAPDPGHEASATLEEMAAVPFDLERGPLLRLRLLRTAPGEHRLLWTDHHIITDAASSRLFFDELRQLYEADEHGEPVPLPEAPLQYADFAAWERGWLHPSSPHRASELAWWKDALRDAAAPPRVPFTRSDSEPAADPSEGVVFWGLDPDVTHGLDRLGREEAATWYMVRLAAFAAQLAVETGSEDLVLGTYASGRPLPATQSMLGFFSNVVTLRFRLAPELSFREVVGRVRACVADTSPHTSYPYELLCEELRAEGIVPPEIQLIFNPAASDRPPRISGLELTRLRRTYAAMPWGFTFGPNRHREARECGASFDARVHDPAEVRAFIERHRRFAAQAADSPDRPIGALLGSDAVTA
jgi:amino acid adenylation domain-containing protein